jgi:hypothetical protein
MEVAQSREKRSERLYIDGFGKTTFQPVSEPYAQIAI